MTDIIKRTTMMVRDAEKAAQWYENVFGMTRFMDIPFTLSGTQLAAGKKGDQTRLTIMKAEHDVIGMIGLLEFTDPRRPDIPEGQPTELSFATPIFVVAAKDCTATVERARAAGSLIHAEPRPWEVTGADGKRKEMLGASFWDLDGHFFEVNQIVKIHEN